MVRPLAGLSAVGRSDIGLLIAESMTGLVMRNAFRWFSSCGWQQALSGMAMVTRRPLCLTLPVLLRFLNVEDNHAQPLADADWSLWTMESVV
jgi:hypothetical protein